MRWLVLIAIGLAFHSWSQKSYESIRDSILPFTKIIQGDWQLVLVEVNTSPYTRSSDKRTPVMLPDSILQQEKLLFSEDSLFVKRANRYYYRQRFDYQISTDLIFNHPVIQLVSGKKRKQIIIGEMDIVDYSASHIVVHHYDYDFLSPLPRLTSMLYTYKKVGIPDESLLIGSWCVCQETDDADINRGDTGTIELHPCTEREDCDHRRLSITIGKEGCHLNYTYTISSLDFGILSLEQPLFIEPLENGWLVHQLWGSQYLLKLSENNTLLLHPYRQK